MTLRYLLAAIALLFAFPAAAQTIPATCDTIKAVLASATGGEVISLKGNCSTITITKQYSRQVTINAGGGSVAGLRFKGAANVRWRSGLITAPEGIHGFAAGGYGIQINGGAANIRFDGVTVTAAKKGVVIDIATNIIFADAKFTLLGEDGIIASRVTGFTVTRSRFWATIGKPQECLAADGTITYGMGQRFCVGVWQDGYHPDAVQMRNGVINARLSYNLVEGPTQGLAQMDTTGDAPLQTIAILFNTLRTTTYHPITLKPACINCRIENNDVRRGEGSLVKAVIIAGAARRCGNYAQDDTVRDLPCP